MQPYEIIAAPFEIWIAPVGEAFPAVNAAPAGNWAKLGTSGNKNYSEDGVTVVHEEEVEEFRVLGHTGPVKAVRKSEGLRLSCVLYDLTLEQYRAILSFNTITTTAAGTGTPGHKAVNLYRGLALAERALLVRGVSPYGASFTMQYELRRCYFRSEAEIVFQKGEPAGIEIEMVALVDPAASAGQEFGVLRAQHQAPL